MLKRSAGPALVPIIRATVVKNVVVTAASPPPSDGADLPLAPAFMVPVLVLILSMALLVTLIETAIYATHVVMLVNRSAAPAAGTLVAPAITLATAVDLAHVAIASRRAVANPHARAQLDMATKAAHMVATVTLAPVNLGVVKPTERDV